MSASSPRGDSSEEPTQNEEDRHRSRRVLASQTALYVVVEAQRPLAGGARFSLEGVDEVVVLRGSTRRASRERADNLNRLSLELPGRLVSAVHARLFRRGAEFILEDAGSTNGSYVNGRRVTSSPVGERDVIEIGRVFMTLRTTNTPVEEPPGDLDSEETEPTPAGLVTLLPDVARSLADLRLVASSILCLVLVGETGTGKEVLARAVHELSRRTGPFVAVNCGALTETLAESQLFGHVRGAFSGAVADAPGFVRAAHGGTLLLDEVNDLHRSAQAALLRVLQEREVVPVGGARPQAVDVRFVAASAEPLDDAVQTGRFRADLLARLSGFTHKLPPLRERREDVGLLVSRLLRKIGVVDSDSPQLEPELALALLRYDWPLNVRELEQLLRRGWLLAKDGVILAEQAFSDPTATASDEATEIVLSLEESELRHRLLAALETSGGNVMEAARELGKAPAQVYRWMKRFSVDQNKFR